MYIYSSLAADGTKRVRELPYAAATVRRIVVCTFGRFTTGHTQAKAHACMCAPKYYDLKWHEFVFYATRPLHAGEQDAVGCIVRLYHGNC